MKKVVQVVVVFLFLFFLLVQLFSEMEESEQHESYKEEEACVEFAELDSFGVSKRIARSWRDGFNNGNFCTEYEMWATDKEASTNFRNSLRSPRYQSDNEYWGKVYGYFFDNDRYKLSFLEDSIRVVAARQGFTSEETIHYVVSMVQDIPYHYIMTEGCQGFNDHPCVPQQRFGLLTPAEFLYTLDGDCDTRTVLLYTLLTNLGFRPVIVNSVQYGHSMLAIDLPINGDYLEYQGQRFYFWETTATGWAPGMLPPDMNNTNYWNIVLAYEIANTK